MHTKDYCSDERYPRSVLKFKSDKQTNRYHPTQKPLSLLRYLIKTYTNEGETVLDNCMGSGSTPVACIQTNRSYIGIDIEKKYYITAVDRIEEALGKVGLFAS